MLAREGRIKSVFISLSATKARYVLFNYIVSGGVFTDLLVSTCILRLKVRLPIFVWSPPESSISCFCRQLSAVMHPASDAALISLCRQPSRGHCDCSRRQDLGRHLGLIQASHRRIWPRNTRTFTERASHNNSCSFSSLGRYVFGSEISYNKAPPRLPGLGC